MHIVNIETRGLEETAQAIDLGQDAADAVFLSFADSDLNALAAAHVALPAPRPSLRLANLANLKHPYSVDLYLERTCAGARFVCVRLLGGVDYWRYGAAELAALARTKGFKLALLPGDSRDDARLLAGSTVDAADWERLRGLLDQGGPVNAARALRAFAGGAVEAAEAVASFGRHHAIVDAVLDRVAQAPRIPPSAMLTAPTRSATASTSAPRALILFYRSIYLANDLAPIDALRDALAARGFDVECLYVTSLKDPAAIAPLREALEGGAFEIILNATAFSGRLDDGTRTLDAADAPVLQAVLAASSEESWAASPRGLSPTDIAMNVALPELDGRILTRAVSFKRLAERDPATQHARAFHAPVPNRVAYVADLALAWAALRRKPRSERRLAMILSDYPGKAGRIGAAIGLDTPKSAMAIASWLAAEGYAVTPIADEAALMEGLSRAAPQALLALEDYRRLFAPLPEAFRDAVEAHWGDAALDDSLSVGAFRFRVHRAGELVIAVQPDRGSALQRKGQYHDAALAPRHAYVAFHLWLRHAEGIDAMIHLGAHGTLEWLPGKALALSDSCASEVLLGPTPVIYPFILNNPGEAAQAKRRIGAVTLGHMTPPLVEAGAGGAARELESLFDEYAEAQSLDPARARLIAERILGRADETGLLRESGAATGTPEARLVALDAWLCDLKEMRIGDGLHVYGGMAGDADLSQEARQSCANGERGALLRALDGRFIEPGPAGAPSRGRRDVLPTGRNIYSIDPRAVPTRNAYELGRRNADALCRAYAQEHGDWPKSVVLDLWGSATTRTGGEEIGQALALLGVRPRWDHASNRVSGFDILPLAALERGRVDVTLRISGLFRDAFAGQIALLDSAIQAVAQLDEAQAENPLCAALGAEARLERIFGAAPGAYGIGLSRIIAVGAWESRDALAQTYLDATDHAYSGEGEAHRDPGGYAKRISASDAYAHIQDLPGIDALSDGARADHEGGFAAAASMLGAKPALYHVDATRLEGTVVRPLKREVARALRARAANPRWLEGQMRHGWRGAIEIADALDNLFAFAALSECVESRQFDMLFDATLGEERVRGFLVSANPDAARAMAARFQEAERRGFWTARRNSSAAILDSMLGEAA